MKYNGFDIVSEALNEISMKKKLAVKIAKATTSKSGRTLARKARRQPGAYAALGTITGHTAKGPMTRKTGSKIVKSLKRGY